MIKRGTSIPFEKGELTESKVQAIIGTSIKLQKKYCPIVPNCFYRWDLEADLMGVRKSGFVDEFEIKLTVADFKNDASKTVRLPKDGEKYSYECLPKYEALETGRLLNYFWYIVPKDMVTVEDIPKFAGLIYIDKGLRGYKYTIIKDAKRLNSNKITDDQLYSALRKMGYRYWNLIEKGLKQGLKQDLKLVEIVK